MRKDNQVRGEVRPDNRLNTQKNYGTKMSIATVAKMVLLFHKESYGLATTKMNIL
jgi:hypothetical protein